jgi:hypothetical protein
MRLFTQADVAKWRRPMASNRDISSEMTGSSGLVGLDTDGVNWADLIALDDCCPASERERIAAIEWIAGKWFSKPIAPQRWRAVAPRIKDELNNRAMANGTTPEKELKACVWQALLIAVDEVGGVLTADFRGNVRATLNDLVVQDLLGPDWQQTPPEDIETLIEVLPDLAAQDIQAELETAIALDTVTSKARLTKHEAKVVAAVRETGSIADAGRRLGVKPAAARVAFHRAVKKLKAANIGASIGGAAIE